jgi:phage/plasmid-associated DNA primase
MPRVLGNGIRKTTSDVMETTYDKYMRGADPVRYFVEKVLEKDSGSKVKKLDMYSSYEEFCNSNGLALESDQSFSRKLSKDFGFKYKMYREKNGERNYYWIEVKVADWKLKELDAQSKLEYSEETKEELM